MAFDNPPIEDLFVPSNAGQLLIGGGRAPGVIVTTDVPDILKSTYANPTTVVLYYSNSETAYWYELLYSGARIRGYVFEDTYVREVYREPINGDPTTDPGQLWVTGEAKFSGGFTGYMPGQFVAESIRSIQLGPFTTTPNTIDSVVFTALPTVKYRAEYHGSYQSSVALDDIGFTFKVNGQARYDKRVCATVAQRGLPVSFSFDFVPIPSGVQSACTVSVEIFRIVGTGNIFSYGGADNDNILSIHYA